MKYFFAVTCILFISCSMIDMGEQTPLKGMSVGEAWVWIDRNIEFKSDIIDDFQLPSTTFTKRTGDCEDFCILLMSVMNEQGPAPELVCINLKGSWHYIVSWNAEYYEPQEFCMRYEKSFVDANFLWSFSLSESIYLAH
jgi:hypothetical protein